MFNASSKVHTSTSLVFQTIVHSMTPVIQAGKKLLLEDGSHENISPITGEKLFVNYFHSNNFLSKEISLTLHFDLMISAFYHAQAKCHSIRGRTKTQKATLSQDSFFILRFVCFGYVFPFSGIFRYQLCQGLSMSEFLQKATPTNVFRIIPRFWQPLLCKPFVRHTQPQVLVE